MIGQSLCRGQQPTKVEKREGDPLNLIVVGELDTILSVFALAKWDETESLAFRSAWRMKRAYMKGNSYRYSPISSLFYERKKARYSPSENQRRHS